VVVVVGERGVNLGQSQGTVRVILAYLLGRYSLLVQEHDVVHADTRAVDACFPEANP
jgi:hypothetical protein